MARPQIVEVDYYELRNQLARAAATGGRIERLDQVRWAAYVKDHKINEIAMMHWGKSKFERVEAVIIDTGGDWDGFYVYSADQEAALKWVRKAD